MTTPETNTFEKSFFKCRMRPNPLPKPNELVFVQIVSTDELGANCALLEYGNVEGIIVYAEASRFRVPNLRKVLRKGRNLVCAVLRVDEKRSFIDLSKRRVTPEESKRTEENFAASKVFHAAMADLAVKRKTQLADVYRDFGWRIFGAFSVALDGLKLLAKERTAFEKTLEDFEKKLRDYEYSNEINREANWRGFLNDAESIAKRKLGQSNAFRVRAEFTAYCFAENGVGAIIKAVKSAKAVLNDSQLEIKYLAAPKYLLQYKNENKELALINAQNVLEEFKRSISGAGGVFSLVQTPEIVNLKEDEEKLKKMMERMEREEKEVDGDELLSE